MILLDTPICKFDEVGLRERRGGVRREVCEALLGCTAVARGGSEGPAKVRLLEEDEVILLISRGRDDHLHLNEIGFIIFA